MRKENKDKKQSPDTELIVRIAKDVVEQAAPEELPAFSALSRFYSKKPGSVLKQQMAKDDELGFGAGSASQVLAPTILLIVQQVVVQVSGNVAAKGSGTFLRRLWKKTSEEPIKPSGSSAYTQADIQAYAYKTALTFNVPEAKAQQIAAIVAGRLADSERGKM